MPEPSLPELHERFWETNGGPVFHIELVDSRDSQSHGFGGGTASMQGRDFFGCYFLTHPYKHGHEDALINRSR